MCKVTDAYIRRTSAMKFMQFVCAQVRLVKNPGPEEEDRVRKARQAFARADTSWQRLRNKEMV